MEERSLRVAAVGRLKYMSATLVASSAISQKS